MAKKLHCDICDEVIENDKDDGDSPTFTFGSYGPDLCRAHRDSFKEALKDWVAVAQNRSPVSGEYVYLDEGQKSPVTVVRTRGHQVMYADGHLALRYAHKGNLHDSEGGRPWWVSE